MEHVYVYLAFLMHFCKCQGGWHVSMYRCIKDAWVTYKCTWYVKSTYQHYIISTTPLVANESTVIICPETSGISTTSWINDCLSTHKKQESDESNQSIALTGSHVVEWACFHAWKCLKTSILAVWNKKMNSKWSVLWVWRAVSTRNVCLFHIG